MAWSPVTPRHFAWQAWHVRFTWQVWHNVTSTFVLRGRRGTDGTGWRAWAGLVARDAAALCVAGVALGDIYVRFTWQVWHNVTSIFVLRGRRGTDGTGWRAWAGLVARDAAALCVAGVALGDIYVRLTWQAWHNLTSTFVLRNTPSSTHHFVTHHLSPHHLPHTLFHIQLCHPPSFTHHVSHTTLSPTIFDTPSFTHNFSPHHFSHTTLSHTIFHTPSFTHHFVTHPLSQTILSHTTLSHTIFHTPSFTHHFVTHPLSQTILSHTTLSHTIFHTPSFTHALSHTLFV